MKPLRTYKPGQMKAVLLKQQTRTSSASARVEQGVAEKSPQKHQLSCGKHSLLLRDRHVIMTVMIIIMVTQAATERKEQNKAKKGSVDYCSLSVVAVCV